MPKTTEANIESILMPCSLVVVIGLGWAVKKFNVKRLLLGTFVVNNIGLVFLLLKFLLLNWFINTMSQRGFNVDIDSKDNCKS